MATTTEDHEEDGENQTLNNSLSSMSITNSHSNSNSYQPTATTNVDPVQIPQESNYSLDDSSANVVEDIINDNELISVKIADLVMHVGQIIISLMKSKQDNIEPRNFNWLLLGCPE